MKTLITIVVAAVTVAVLVLVVSAAYAIPVYYLWNWLMPVIFELPQVTLLQAWGLMFLSGLLIRSNGGSSSSK